MNVVKKVINVQQKDGSISEYNISFDVTKEPAVSIIFDYEAEQVFKERDFFNCLKLIRVYFDKAGAKVLCNGARIDVYPSRMSRDTGRGRKAYVLVQGRQALRTDLVDIFDAAAPDLIGCI
ncbi:hypothetical protein SG34_006290 [Thalassomonas viridans]|uniref:Uncharacterized protein n=1 Tax=Thalassomonas viridans TaxID=137584 RepID=A0AAF0CAN9_9GAMM|nr:hypothetical protein [Thalassomonas viridans]WDE06525.1 hypothetical protein SG34_006290 [Thalassomonas viridans]